jgi:hypothetical protein
MRNVIICTVVIAFIFLCLIVVVPKLVGPGDYTARQQKDHAVVRKDPAVPNPQDFEKRQQSVRDGTRLQTQGVVAGVGDLLKTEDFARLEQTASTLRDEKVRSRGGNWQLAYFYDNLALRWTGFYPSREQWLYGVFDRWIEQHPDSVTPRIAKAKAYIDFAWDARGLGYANTVTETGWKVFHEKLSRAWAILETAETLDVKDPEIYSLFLEAGRGLGKPHWELEHIFQKGIAVERAYCPLYYKMATTLMPRWGGSVQKLRAFMDRAVELTKDQEGQSFYPRISDMVFRYFRFDDFQRKFGFPYEQIKQGYIDLLERYPNSDYYLSSFCYYASLNKDKETARGLFERIGDNWVSSAWRGRESFDYHRNWAYTE